jgi:hypothetical protein
MALARYRDLNVRRPRPLTKGFGTGYDENVALRRRLVMQSGRGVMDNLRGFEPRDAGSIPAGRAKKTMR